MKRLSLLLAWGGLVSLPSLLQSQRPRSASVVGTASSLIPASGVITGVVEDSLGVPFAAVRVAVMGSDVRLQTDSAGRFRFVDVAPGSYLLKFGRVGLEATTVLVNLDAGDTLSVAIEMRLKAQALAAVDVVERGVASKLVDFGFEHRRRSAGVSARHFITRAEIERGNAIALGQVIRRAIGPNSRHDCSNPTIWVDGVMKPAPPTDMKAPVVLDAKGKRISFEDAPELIDGMRRPDAVDDIPPSWIEGLEIYLGSAQVPSQFRPTGVFIGCVIVVWTR